MKTNAFALNYQGFRFLPDIIRHAVWLSFRFSLSFRDVEELLAQRGIVVTYETVRQWCLTCGQTDANELRRRRPRCGDTWHMDEVFLTIRGERRSLWRAVDQNGNGLDILVQSRRNKHAAKRLFRKLRVWVALCPARDHHRYANKVWQPATQFSARAFRAIKHPVIVLELLLVRASHYSQDCGNGSLSRCQDRSHHEHFGPFPHAFAHDGFCQHLWQAGLAEYDELAGIGWDWQSVDGSTVKAPFAQAAVGPAPTDRGKQGTKRSLLCDRRGVPLGLVIEGANRHDIKLLSATLDHQVGERPEPTVEHPQHLCLDAGYDYEPGLCRPLPSRL